MTTELVVALAPRLIDDELARAETVIKSAGERGTAAPPCAEIDTGAWREHKLLVARLLSDADWRRLT